MQMQMQTETAGVANFPAIARSCRESGRDGLPALRRPGGQVGKGSSAKLGPSAEPRIVATTRPWTLGRRERVP